MRENTVKIDVANNSLCLENHRSATWISNSVRFAARFTLSGCAVPTEEAVHVQKILIANNGSEGAFKALAEALRLAHSHESEAHMIYVEENIRWNAPETGGGKKDP